MTDFCEYREVRGRKQYRCGLCGLRIRRGAKHVYVASQHDGTFSTERYHAVCSHIANDTWDAMDWDSRSYGDEPNFRRFNLQLPLLRSQSERLETNIRLLETRD